MATAYIFLLVGLILIVVSWRYLGRTAGALRQGQEAGRPGRGEDMPRQEPEEEGYPARAGGAKVEFMIEEGRETAGPPGDRVPPYHGFQHYLREALKAPASPPDPPGEGALPLEAIIRAVDAGESLESVAKRFGRGKGEIELILNLRRLKSGPR